jgi:hypothetical protein
MSNLRYFKPGISGGSFYLHRSGEDVPDVEIPRTGIAIPAGSELLNELEDHPLKNHRMGFIEVKSLDRDEPIEYVPDEEEEKPTSTDITVKETRKHVSQHDLSPQEVIDFTDGDEREGVKAIRERAEKRLAETSDDSGTDDSQREAVIVDDVSNINQLKDYLVDEHGMDGRTMTDADTIISAAKKLEPLHQFPNVEIDG